MPEIDYVAVLSDLERRRGELEAAIAAIRAIVQADSASAPIPKVASIKTPKRTATEIFANPSKEVLTEAEYAAYIGKAIQTVRKNRARGMCPKFLKIAGAIRYRRADIEEYLTAHESQTG